MFKIQGTRGKIQTIFNDQIPKINARIGNWILKFGVCLVFVSCILVVVAGASPKPQRIVSGMPSITEMLFALGLGDKIVGVTTNCNYPLAATKKTKVGGFFLNLEKVVSLKPDLVLLVESAQPTDIKKFRRFGLPVKTVDPQSVDQVMATLSELGTLTGTEKKAAEVVTAMKNKLDKGNISIRNLLFRKHALVIIGLKPLIVAGKGTFIDDVMLRSGVWNIARKTKGAYPQLSFENLLKADPDYIIIPKGVITEAALDKDSRWQSLDAVRKGRVLFLDSDVLSRPGPRVVSAVEEIASFVHQ